MAIQRRSIVPTGVVIKELRSLNPALVLLIPLLCRLLNDEDFSSEDPRLVTGAASCPEKMSGQYTTARVFLLHMTIPTGLRDRAALLAAPAEVSQGTTLTNQLLPSCEELPGSSLAKGMTRTTHFLDGTVVK